MKSYKDLDIFSTAKRLAIEMHTLSLQLPKFEMFEEGSQLRRSSKSVATHIVEEYGRKEYKQDFVRYLSIALAECDETMLHLDFLFETGSITHAETYHNFKSEYEQLSKKINAFLKWVQVNWKSSK